MKKVKLGSEGSDSNSEGSASNSEGDQYKRLTSHLTDEDLLTLLNKVYAVSERIRNSRSNSREQMEKTIMEMCSIIPLPLPILAQLLDKNPDYLRQNFLKPMIESGKIKPQFSKENHPRQAYISTARKKGDKFSTHLPHSKS